MQKFSFLFMVCLLSILFGFVTSATAQDDEKITRNLFGLSFGSRSISIKTSDIYFDGEKVDFGSMSPFELGIFYQRQTESDLVVKVDLDFFISKTTGILGLIGGGYRFGTRRFNLVPLFSLGYGGADTKFGSYALSSNTKLDGKVFVGKGTYNYGRGAGEDIKLSISSGFFIMQPQVQGQIHFGKISLLGMVGYNFAFGRKGEIELSGKGYKSEDDYNNSSSEPEDISVSTNISEMLENSNGERITETPLRFSGLSWSLGLAFKFGE